MYAVILAGREGGWVWLHTPTSVKRTCPIEEVASAPTPSKDRHDKQGRQSDRQGRGQAGAKIFHLDVHTADNPCSGHVIQDYFTRQAYNRIFLHIIDHEANEVHGGGGQHHYKKSSKSRHTSHTSRI